MSAERDLLDSILRYQELHRADQSVGTDVSDAAAEEAAAATVDLLTKLIDTRIQNQTPAIVDAAVKKTGQSINQQMRGL